METEVLGGKPSSIQKVGSIETYIKI